MLMHGIVSDEQWTLSTHTTLVGACMWMSVDIVDVQLPRSIWVCSFIMVNSMDISISVDSCKLSFRIDSSKSFRPLVVSSSIDYYYVYFRYYDFLLLQMLDLLRSVWDCEWVALSARPRRFLVFFFYINIQSTKCNDLLFWNVFRLNFFFIRRYFNIINTILNRWIVCVCVLQFVVIV